MFKSTPTHSLKLMCLLGALTTTSCISLSAHAMSFPAGTGPYVYLGAGESFADFTESDFEYVVQKNFSPYNVSWTHTSTDFHSTIGEMAIGYQILSWLGLELGAQTPYTTTYKSNFTDTENDANYSDKFKDKIHLYDMMLTLTGNIGKLPISEFVKVGVAYESLEVNYDQNNLSSSTNGSIPQADDHAYLPAAALGLAYNFKSLPGLSLQGQWMHVEGRTASVNEDVTYGDGSSYAIQAISKIPSINNFTLGIKYVI